jgi:tetratricopeptide (TPR) repeat protein
MGILCCSFLLFASVLFQKRQWKPYILYVPFIALPIFALSASRNILLGYMGMMVIVGISLRDILATSRQFVKTLVIAVVLGSLSLLSVYWIIQKRAVIASERMYFPVQAAEFAKKYLKGRMFNDYTYGGYMLYAVYPSLQVLIDGRTEVYLCCEVPDYLDLAAKKTLPDEEYRGVVMGFFEKYQIDFAILPVMKHSILRKIGTLLSSDKEWSLVYWDDSHEIFIKKNGKNDEIIKRMGSIAATPYLREPFAKENVEQAIFEYERMDGVVKSSHTSNALGYIALMEENIPKAYEKFYEAISIDPTNESPYMNLAELSAKDGNIPGAIDLYQKALRRAQDRGLIYIRLGQLLLEQNKEANRENVKKLWENGEKNTVDEDARGQLVKLLEELH